MILFPKNILSLISLFTVCTFTSCSDDKKEKALTQITLTIPAKLTAIDPMIYGQMLENVNDSMIYGGVVDKQGNEHTKVTALLSDLNIPVMRWPGGTVIHEYHWQEGIGPRGSRKTVPNIAWGGIENYQFGTDEFLQWCKKIGTVPYINFNMGNNPKYGGTLDEAAAWVEYVNGSVETTYGKKRATNGHAEPYNVKYWCLGNENYLGIHDSLFFKESDTVYADKLNLWATKLKNSHPNLQLLGIGHSLKWNETVLEKNGSLVDFLTQHYYVNANVKDDRIEYPYSSLFAPDKMEAHLVKLGGHLKKVNEKLGRSENPIRLSVDEWNNRHAVYNGTDYKFTRHSPRRQVDAAVVAGMLNVFIRQNQTVGMANYIFPVNAHGLIRTVGDTGAYKTPLYYVFQQYREWMTGDRLDLSIKGPGISATEAKPTIEGDTRDVDLGDKELTFIDGAAVLNADGNVYVSLVNRSTDSQDEVSINIPDGYAGDQQWQLTSKDIQASNTGAERTKILPVIKKLDRIKGQIKLTLDPCSVTILRLGK